MAKLDRKNMKVFGSSAGFNQISIFGSLAAGSPNFSTDPETIQSLSNYLDGWYGAVLGPNAPAIEDMNALHFVYAYQLAYLFQEGVAEWDTNTTYFIGSLVNDGFGNLYKSLTDNNLGNSLNDITNWAPQTTPPGDISMQGGEIIPPGYVSCDGTLYAIVDFIILWWYIGNAWGTSDGVIATGDTVISTNTITVSDTTGMNINDYFRATFGGVNLFPPGTKITNVSGGLGGTITVDSNALATQTGASVHTGLHFNVPTTQGLFPRGQDQASGNDPDAGSRTASQPGGNTGDNVGSFQADDLASHDHTYNAGTNLGGLANIVHHATINQTANTTSFTGGNETRPKNFYVRFKIKT